MIRLLRTLAVGVMVLTLAACVGDEVWAPDDAVARATYVPPGAPTVTLITSINTTSNAGAHSALLIDGAQRLLFDPAGNWHNPGVPERNDVLFGMSQPYLDMYMAFQSNGAFEVRTQTIDITPAVAQQLSQAVQSYGAVPPAYCSRSITEILGATPGFTSIQQTFFPLNTMEQFAQLPGVREATIIGTTGDEEDASDAVLAAQLAN
ncbi:hypothetical protein KUL25_13370 [Rhodobacteraceae bacterium N5(2021)]|uniref:Lipoprotein n=1 Tax=Gymnodinialimonas phycosphaerae TaxID=2841589 RepID=A0A975TSK8_9RHOB|nr:hypothetical protein [Gymnodinialimonas phycosphaerae]MBY4893755.1 hypothetical protein [Gymnodinialimonas phycosphaerae]